MSIKESEARKRIDHWVGRQVKHEQQKGNALPNSAKIRQGWEKTF